MMSKKENSKKKAKKTKDNFAALAKEIEKKQKAAIRAKSYKPSFNPKRYGH